MPSPSVICFSRTKLLKNEKKKNIIEKREKKKKKIRRKKERKKKKIKPKEKIEMTI